MQRARKLTEPTGKPVKMIPPTGGSNAQLRVQDLDARAYEDYTGPVRKSTRGGRVNRRDFPLTAETSYTDLYNRERRRILKHRSSDGY